MTGRASDAARVCTFDDPERPCDCPSDGPCLAFEDGRPHPSDSPFRTPPIQEIEPRKRRWSNSDAAKIREGRSHKAEGAAEADKTPWGLPPDKPETNRSGSPLTTSDGLSSVEPESTRRSLPDNQEGRSGSRNTSAATTDGLVTDFTDDESPVAALERIALDERWTHDYWPSPGGICARD